MVQPTGRRLWINWGRQQNTVTVCSASFSSTLWEEVRHTEMNVWHLHSSHYKDFLDHQQFSDLSFSIDTVCSLLMCAYSNFSNMKWIWSCKARIIAFFFINSSEQKVNYSWNLIIFMLNLRYRFWPGHQSAKPAGGGVPRSVSNCHCHLSIYGWRRHHISIQHCTGYEGAHRACQLCPACWKPSMCSLDFVAPIFYFSKMFFFFILTSRPPVTGRHC